MSNLFIIGNGFDIAHCLPTKYEDFHKYLLENYLIGDASFDINSTITPDGGEDFDTNELVTFLNHLVSETEKDGENWCDFEANLGRLNFDVYFDEMTYLYDEEEPYRQAYIYEDVAENFLKATLKIKDLFFEWVSIIDISEAPFKESFYNLIDPERDIFMTFNYTYVLEEIYDADNVEHIHGKQGEYTIIGHGDTGREFQSYPLGTEWSLSQLYDSLRKNTDEVIKNKNQFFDGLRYIKNIYSYGFSFSEVDLPYIKEICRRIDTKKKIWYLSDFDCHRIRKKHEKKIRQCGFEGEFKVFSITETHLEGC
ncbi:hypothetical protein CHCC15325_3096 [Bacillus licheniformis]|uniref:bacteriophage abortive infection AbiH family protein n=1 Tax=Bacillus licheniformis TaxID=1402 RepID=UPI0011A8F733|nr:bacteriophage abortive infection AbiH family protein [Bacillus licheniformis]TWL55428.1 hypothetical protein CHCC15325_3096 [Bacillus licheniformis]